MSHLANISTVRIAVPKAVHGEIIRHRLVTALLHCQKKLVYIHAGAGYGKTTLLSQLANFAPSIVWVTLDGESDVLAFADILCKAIEHTFNDYDFIVSEHLPFEGKSNFVTLLANAFISSIEKLDREIVMILEDFHTIENPQIKEFISCVIKYKPENIRFFLSSREAPSHEFIPLRIRGEVLELTQKDLAFTKDEVIEIIGFL